ncbi:hypothetical protein Tco_1054188 [Tanacetum coccineum]|uniref:Reverse transcriptase domain-containing protein n=1 Tax=Tanacetum coccineum TaxID=301880 RepID=A0ABQ5GW31_9ASTR
MSIEINKKKKLQQLEQVANLSTYPSRLFNSFCYDIDDDDGDEYSFATQEYLKKFSSAITSDLPKSDSPIMEDKHLDTIPEMESDELIMSNVEDLFHTPSESDGISESKCDFPICDDSSLKNDEVLDDIISIPPGNSNDHFNVESCVIEFVLNRDNMISSPKIDFLLEEFAGELAFIAPIPPGIVKADFDPKGYIHFIENLMYDNSFSRPLKTLKDDYETIINSNNDYSSSDDDSPYSEDIDYVDELRPDPELLSLEVETNTFDNSLPQFETFNFLDDHTKETSSGSTTTYANISLPEYDSFHLDSEPDLGDFTMDVVEDIFDNPTREPRVHVPNVLPTHPTIHLDSDFTLSSDSLGSDLVVSFPSKTRNKIFDPRIFIEIQSNRFLSPNEFSISFICDPLSPVFDTLLPFSSENEDNVFNPGIFASNEEKSSHLLSHRGFKAFQLISESPMIISGRDIPILDVLIARIFEASHAHGFVFRSLGLLSLSFNMGIQYPNLID